MLCTPTCFGFDSSHHSNAAFFSLHVHQGKTFNLNTSIFRNGNKSRRLLLIIQRSTTVLKLDSRNHDTCVGP